MKNKLLILLIIVLAFSVAGCRKPDPVPTPLPTLPVNYLQIPDYVVAPNMVNYWHRVLGSKWTSDETTTGYSNYRFTPIELTLSEIPDVNKPGRIIKKTPYHGDCEDFAAFNAYVAYVKFNPEKVAVIFILDTGNVQLAHAISYAIIDGIYHFFDNERYRGAFNSIDEFIKQKYPNWIVYFHKPLKEYLEELYNQGHLEYTPPKVRKVDSSKKRKIECIDDVCSIR